MQMLNATPLDAAALALYRHATQLHAAAADLRQAALQLVERAAAAPTIATPASPARSFRASAVATGEVRALCPVTDVPLVAKPLKRVNGKASAHRSSTLDLDAANRELAGCPRSRS